jgi:hypothetical protein
MLRAAVAVMGSVVLAGCAVIGVRAGTPEPAYTVVDRTASGLEIRRYAARTAAEITVDTRGRRSDEGRAFGVLANYIFGGNRRRDSIAMTAPVESFSPSAQVAMTAPVESLASEDLYRMRFFLPDGYSATSAPVPNDSRIVLRDLAPQVMAVLRFSGSRDDALVDRQKNRLMAVLDDSSWRAAGKPVAYFYDPPWTLPALRRNEVAVAVDPR